MADGVMKLYPLLALLAILPVAAFIVGRDVYFVVLSAISVVIIAGIIYLMFLSDAEAPSAH